MASVLKTSKKSSRRAELLVPVEVTKRPRSFKSHPQPNWHVDLQPPKHCKWVLWPVHAAPGCSIPLPVLATNSPTGPHDFELGSRDRHPCLRTRATIGKVQFRYNGELCGELTSMAREGIEPPSARVFRASVADPLRTVGERLDIFQQRPYGQQPWWLSTGQNPPETAEFRYYSGTKSGMRIRQVCTA